MSSDHPPDRSRHDLEPPPPPLTRSRTPKPYLHRPRTVFNPAAASRRGSADSGSGGDDELHKKDDGGRDGSKAWKAAKSPSESGTEADDEGYVLFKALPAPPLRPRKGLKSGADETLELEGLTPLLTPTRLEGEDGKRFLEEARERVQGRAEGTDEERRVVKVRRRRRAEVVRRVCEVALLGGIGVLLVCSRRGRAAVGLWERVELLSHTLVFVGLLALYPLRLILYSWKVGSSEKPWRQRMRLPPTFDPAPILYPAFLSVLIVLALPAMAKRILLPNLVLSLSALPPQLFPLDYGNGYNMAHWLCAIIPLIISQNTSIPNRLYATKPYMLKTPPPDGLHPEDIVSLFALHQSLLPPLRYLSTTSLLSAELQLLAIGLTNLLLFTTEPQMVILSTILWYGGVGLFLFCRRALQSNVVLARIPRWRFRRVGRIIGARQSFLAALKEGIEKKARAARRYGQHESAVDSDADEDTLEIHQRPKVRKGSLKLDILDSINSIKQNFLRSDGDEPKSAIEPIQRKAVNAFRNVFDHQRRNTLPTMPVTNGLVITPALEHERQKNKRKAHPFMSLTPTEARVRTWFYAWYTYLIIVVAILGPIRHIIKTNALHGLEPFTWAIGYLFGNLQPVRFSITYWNLSTWIPLPPLTEHPTALNPILSRIPIINSYATGPANSRLILTAYYALVVGLGLLLVLNLTILEVDTRRKVFHGMAVFMFLPTIPLDPCFVSLALSLVLAIFLLLDLLRAAQLPPLSKPLARFLTPYVDGRDLRGPVVISHIFLLIGCAIPLWLSLAAVQRAGDWPWQGWDVRTRDVSMVAGVVCVGMGDAAASLIGRRWGRRKWLWPGGKSLEGSAAFAGAVLVGLVLGKVELWVGGWEEPVAGWLEALAVLGKAACCACGASFMEAVLTGGNDNVVVPVVLWLLVRGVGL